MHFARVAKGSLYLDLGHFTNVNGGSQAPTKIALGCEFWGKRPEKKGRVIEYGLQQVSGTRKGLYVCHRCIMPLLFHILDDS